MNAELRKIRELNTGAFTAELWIDGNLAAGVEDDGRGGGYMYRWADQQLRRSCRRNTLIRLKGDNSDSYHSFKPAWKFSPTVAAKIREDHGSDLLEIINERFIKGAK